MTTLKELSNFCEKNKLVIGFQMKPKNKGISFILKPKDKKKVVVGRGNKNPSNRFIFREMGLKEV